MNRLNQIIAQAFRVALVIVFLSSQATVFPINRFQSQEKPLVEINFLDVLELPARIDGLRLEPNDKPVRVTCAVVNRSDEALLGLRLILLTFDSSGKLRNRLTWTERLPLPAFSITKAVFQPVGLGNPRAGDYFLLGIDEVFGRETIWHADRVDKALRAYARGQHNVLPEVHNTPNKI